MTSTMNPELPLLERVLAEHTLLDETQITHLKNIDFLVFISNNLYKMNELYARMQAPYQAGDLPVVRELMHSFLNAGGFIGANALRQVCRHTIYPDLDGDRWPEPAEWFTVVGTLLHRTCEAFLKEHQIQPQGVVEK